MTGTRTWYVRLTEWIPLVERHDNDDDGDDDDDDDDEMLTDAHTHTYIHIQTRAINILDSH